ncbi:cytochrome ubiquinol oxidase subunit I [Sulfobacillus sp. DSM 109850]|uniref:Cytochrome c oxidase subunit 1 n=1 Tax=Sulfobacillus harzensis TaxID=2729629 RepID=A0A7Y0L4R6_9FIRM|nr:cytochrome c oxidase subunit I [Sulfobacillus harzensis]NMP23271.1 cytochrome ubiquinol oxidase subunit I [Sulfobacillus harzensis]
MTLKQWVIHLIKLLFPPQVLLPDIVGIDIGLTVAAIGIVLFLTKTKRWGWLWREWLTTVDHKKIGIMYLIAALIMLFRGGVDALMIRTQLIGPHGHFMGAQQYDEVFTTHGTVMIFFMAMPMVFALFNVAVPLMIGARDVAFPRLNAISFWLFAIGAILLNISFSVGGSPSAGWMSYPPYSELAFNPGPGENYFLLSLQVAGIGTIATGINFLVTVLRMRAPGMTLTKIPIFAWSALITSTLILFAFPPLTVALGLTMLDRLFGASFFTIAHQGMPMMYVNLFWIFGHPEVYILVMPAFGVFSEVVPTFSRKALFGYEAMVISLLAISFLSYGTWVHHFFEMGAGPAVNVFFGLSTMLIAIPTGVKMFNWIFTMWGGRIRLTVPMLWQLAFIPTFVVGGATGVMLAAVPGDYQYHNSYFLIAHFHNVIIGGTVFGLLSGVYYWWPKMFGWKLNERQGRWAVVFFAVGFWVTFLPQYLLGFEGMTRRMATYPSGLGWTALNFWSTIGAYIMAVGFIIMVYNIIWSRIHPDWDTTGDPWDGRTLEWSLPSPAPEYNFARIPVVHARDEWWEMKREGRTDEVKISPDTVKPIHMPRNTPMPVMLALAFFVGAVGMVFSWYWLAIVGGLGVVAVLAYGSFADYREMEIDPKRILNIEAKLGRVES